MAVRKGLIAAAFAAALVGRAAGAQQVVQVPLPYNADVIREPGGTVSGGGIDAPRSADPGGRGFVTQAEAAAHDAVDPRGLPDDGSLAVPGGTIRLGPYDGNNALRFSNFGADDGTWFTVPLDGTYKSVQIYAAGDSSNPFVAPGLRIRWQRLPGASTGGSFDWKRPPQPDVPNDSITEEVLLGGMDTTGPLGAGFEDVDGAQIVRWSYELTPLDRDRTSAFSIQGILEPFPGLSQMSVSVLAITLTTVPEPSSALALAALASVRLARRRRSN